MVMNNLHAGGGRSRLVRPFLALGVLGAMMTWAPVWAAEAPAPSSPATVEGGATATPSTPADTETAPPATEPKTKPAPSGEAAGLTGPAPYVGPSAATAIGAFGREYVTTGDQPIIVQRSGGLAPLLFENKVGNWLTASVSVAETYDTNVFLRSFKQDDFITRVSPSLAFKYNNQILDWSLGTSLGYGYYAKHTRSEDFNYSLNTGGKIKVYRDVAYIIVSDTFTQTSQSNAVDYSSLSSTANVTNLNTFMVSPRMEIPITSRVRFNPQATYTNYWYSSQSQQNRQSYAASGDFSYELSPRLTPALGYRFLRMDGQLSKYNQHYPFLRINYQEEKVTFSGSVGYSRVDLDLGGSSDGMIWDANLTYRLATMTFTLATSSDIDQSSYQNNTTLNQLRKAPQTITSYSASFQKQFRKVALGLSIYYRENTDSSTSDMLSRNIGTSGSLSHDLSSRLSGNFTCRVERSDQRNTVVGVLLDQGTHSLLYQLGYGLTYHFGNEWTASGIYSYTNSTSPQNVSTYNYTDNKGTLAVSKSF